jgi:RNA polymerase sigma-70 factor (ECF subfamily)
VTKKEYHNAVYECSDGLYRFALRLARDQSLAQDLVQDAFEKVWIKRKEIKYEKVKSYLFRTLHNRFIDTTRKHRPISMTDVHEMNYTSNMPSVDLNEVLHEALNQLSTVQKSAVLLRDYEGYSYKEISEILSLSESQVKVYIFRARKQLQQIIGSLDEVI